MNADAALPAPRLLLAAIRDPSELTRLSLPQWERLLACARRNAVLAYVAERAATAGVVDALPERPRVALQSAQLAAARLAQLARWELDRVRRALLPVGVPIIALKGLAYIVRVKTDERVAAYFRAMDCLNLDFLQGTFRTLLAERKRSQNQDGGRGDE